MGAAATPSLVRKKANKLSNKLCNPVAIKIVKKGAILNVNVMAIHFVLFFIIIIFKNIIHYLLNIAVI